MKKYRVVISQRAKRQIWEYIRYLVEEIKNPQAASAVADDFEKTIEKLEDVAESLKLCDDPDLAGEGIRKILFQNHDYVILYEVVGDEARVYAVYHTLQDYGNLFRSHT